jgi:uncharacterized C2H2 Zn-finger protein
MDLEEKVNKRCEACGYYAETKKDMIEHAGNPHGFVYINSSGQRMTLWH